MPLVNRRIELHAGIAANMGSLRYFSEQRPSFLLFTRLPGRDTARPPFLIFNRRLHEIIARSNGKFFILIHERAIGIAIVAAIVSLLDQRPSLLFFLGFCF